MSWRKNKIEALLNTYTTILTGRGTTALWALLKTLRCPGEGVLVAVNVCEMVVAAILHAQMTPVFHDVDPYSGNGELIHIQNGYTSDVAVWIAVHNYGTPLNIAPMVQWAKGRGVFVIEDVCNALGATVNDRPAGTFGDAAIYSFGYAKIVEMGQGGALTVQDPNYLSKTRSLLETLPSVKPEYAKADASFQAVLVELRQHPLVQKSSVYRALYREYMPYLLYMPDDVLSHRIWEKLSELPEIIKRRKDKAAHYRKLLDLTPICHRPWVEGDIFWRYSFLAPEEVRDALLQELHSQGILASKWFPRVDVLFQEPKNLNSFPGAESFARRVINLWVNEEVTFEDINRTSEIIHDFFRRFHF